MVVTNLLSNACKFSAPPLPVEVELSGRGFRIVDQGKGIPRDVLERLGQPFNTGNEESSGTGLGLAWVQTICRRFHWKLNIQSSLQGTEISVDFGDQRMVASVDNLPSQTTVSK
jgi:signal transduction histidine kinase